MKSKTKINRFRNYQPFKILQNNLSEQIFETDDGNYQLVVLDKGGNFILQMSSGEIIKDSFNDFTDRADLYKFLEVGEIYDWMLKVKQIVQINLPINKK